MLIYISRDFAVDGEPCGSKGLHSAHPDFAHRLNAYCQSVSKHARSVLLLLPEACYSRFAPGIEVLTETFEDPGLREAILAAKTPGDVVVAVEDAESRELA